MTPTRERNIDEELQMAIGLAVTTQQRGCKEFIMSFLTGRDRYMDRVLILSDLNLDLMSLQSQGSFIMRAGGQEKAAKDTLALYQAAAGDIPNAEPITPEEVQLVLDTTMAGKSTGEETAGCPANLLTRLHAQEPYDASEKFVPSPDFDTNQGDPLNELADAAAKRTARMPQGRRLAFCISVHQIEKSIRKLGARVTSLTGAVELIEQMYEGTAGCINDVFQAMDEQLTARKLVYVFPPYPTMVTPVQFFQAWGTLTSLDVPWWISFVDSRLERIQRSLITAMDEYVAQSESKRQELQAHAETLLEKCFQSMLTPSAAGDLLLTLKEDFGKQMGAITGEALDRMMVPA
ncbi:hypothetical protein AK812_SmicGene29877 [Symbiodinium microadriaticum]|uniref:Uncharacterized protein n=1 Tax=Symbiodinium microadriaticum TaxID=2951 RepID=A0A1Q9D0Q7_SYMMI|nr:hypothetical protein AK812_SmicGene29877 [Symbiodinium microadriaticum]